MVKKLELPVMESVVLESMTRLEEEDIRHVSGLPDSASPVKKSLTTHFMEFKKN